MKTAKFFVRDIWRLAKPYWFSEDRWAGRGLLAVIVGMSLGIVFLTVLINKWNNAFYDTLQNRDLDGFYHQLGIFCLLAAIYIVVAVYQLYLRQMLQIRWRRWLTERFLDEWLAGKVYYGLQMRHGETDNPDQRIADDIASFVNQTLTLTLGLLEAVVTLASFTGILWGLSGTIDVPLGEYSFSVPGYMVWVALGYSIVGTWLTKRVGKPLIQLNFNQQRFEADFRFSLVRFRENVEGVALYRGEPGEAEVFRERFSHVVRNWWDIMRQRKRLMWLTTGYGQVALVFPFMAAGPRYFSGAIQLGDLMQTASAFNHVQGALSWFVDAYAELASWKATVDRLITFSNAMEEFRSQPCTAAPLQTLKPSTGSDQSLRISGLTLTLPEGGTLITGFNLTVNPGQSALISGPSGVGKSTLFRAIAGLWPCGQGTIALPATGRLLFLPQKPYLPIGSLRSVVSYPTPDGGFTDAAIAEALAACGLPQLAAQLDDARYWTQQLSPGEQQRLAFARTLLQQPDWLFLDEATSAIDEPGERQLYQLLRDRLPKTAVVSIGHRATLAEFHGQQVMLAAS